MARSHDRIPDRWETHHHLSLHHNQARRDQDRDGLTNRGEFKAHLNPEGPSSLASPDPRAQQPA